MFLAWSTTKKSYTLSVSQFLVTTPDWAYNWKKTSYPTVIESGAVSKELSLWIEKVVANYCSIVPVVDLSTFEEEIETFVKYPITLGLFYTVTSTVTVYSAILAWAGVVIPAKEITIFNSYVLTPSEPTLSSKIVSLSKISP